MVDLLEIGISDINNFGSPSGVLVYKIAPASPEKIPLPSEPTFEKNNSREYMNNF